MELGDEEGGFEGRGMDGVARAAGQMTTCKLGETRSGDKYTQFASKQ